MRAEEEILKRISEREGSAVIMAGSKAEYVKGDIFKFLADELKWALETTDTTVNSPEDGELDTIECPTCKLLKISLPNTWDTFDCQDCGRSGRIPNEPSGHKPVTIELQMVMDYAEKQLSVIEAELTQEQNQEDFNRLTGGARAYSDVIGMIDRVTPNRDAHKEVMGDSAEDGDTIKRKIRELINDIKVPVSKKSEFHVSGMSNLRFDDIIKRLELIANPPKPSDTKPVTSVAEDNVSSKQREHNAKEAEELYKYVESKQGG